MTDLSTLVFDKRLSSSTETVLASAIALELSLTAEERTRSRYRHTLDTGETIFLQLPRGTVLHDGDVLQAKDSETRLRILAKPESVLTVKAEQPGVLLRAAYHLGNRHVPLEVAPNYLRLTPDPVLKSMLTDQLDVHVTEEIAPFCPESGAYHHHGH